MTLDEARLTLKELRYYPSLDDFDVEALNVAIKAVEAMQNIKSVDMNNLHRTTIGFLAIIDFLRDISDDGEAKA